MFKKFISMMTAAILLATGLSLLGISTANATPTDATLSVTSTVKGVTVVSLGTPGTNPSNVGARGSVHISTATAADTSNSGSFVTSFVLSDPAASIVYTAKNALGQSLGTINNYNGTAAITNGDFFVIYTESSDSSVNKFYVIDVEVSANGATPSSSSSSSSSSSQTAEQIAAAAAAAAQAAAQAAAEARAAAVAVAQSTLATVLNGDKAGTLSEYRSANINVTTTAALDRLNAEVLKLSAADRSDFAKIKAIADKIEFDESFFNATARPTVATYNAYGVTVTPRTVATINAKVLELPVTKRADVTAIAEIAKVETFVDRVANTDTRSSASATTLISKGLLPADTVYKYTVVNGLSSYPEGSLNTMAKIEAAIKAELDKAGARKAKTEAIKAKIAARRK